MVDSSQTWVVFVVFIIISKTNEYNPRKWAFLLSFNQLIMTKYIFKHHCTEFWRKTNCASFQIIILKIKTI
jgi:hypothetical protein